MPDAIKPGTAKPSTAFHSNASAPHKGTEHRSAPSDAQVNTDNLSPAAARRFERFAGLVDSFEKAAASGAISPPQPESRSEV